MSEAIGELTVLDNMYPHLTLRAAAYTEEYVCLFTAGRAHSAAIDLTPEDARKLGEFLLRFAA
jgi:hypothetical protein